jgi:hypothetical protein
MFVAEMKDLVSWLVAIVIVGVAINYFSKPSKTNASKVDPRDAQIQQLQQDIADLKRQTPKHRYELRAEGFRTWRFDPDTGNTCIQLTAEWDWKKKETKNQSCACEDVNQRYIAINDERTSISYYNTFVAPTCGQERIPQ